MGGLPSWRIRGIPREANLLKNCSNNLDKANKIFTIRKTTFIVT